MCPLRIAAPKSPRTNEPHAENSSPDRMPLHVGQCMSEMHFDVAIIGSGFGGSLTALLLNEIGLRSVLIDRSSHPRLVLGESSTPLADFVLKSLAQRYGLLRVEPLAEY